MFERAPNKKNLAFYLACLCKSFHVILYVITLLTLIRCKRASCQPTGFLHLPNTCLGNWRGITWYFMRIKSRLSVRSSFMVGVVRRTKQHSKQVMDLIMETHKSSGGFQIRNISKAARVPQRLREQFRPLKNIKLSLTEYMIDR